MRRKARLDSRVHDDMKGYIFMYYNLSKAERVQYTSRCITCRDYEVFHVLTVVLYSGLV
jgi:hypothetical protein